MEGKGQCHHLHSIPTWWYRAFSHNVSAAIKEAQNVQSVAMLVSRTNFVEAELYSYLNAFCCSNKLK